jgi:Pregnancy-associated plasma protein-A
MERIFYQMLFFILAFAFSSGLTAQVPEHQILGPHTAYEGPYYIRVFVNYIQGQNDQWTQGVDLASRTAGILARLNAGYNQHDIYFIGLTEPCSAPYQVITASSYIASSLHPTALDIFDRGDDELPIGYAGNIPSTYCDVKGAYSTLPASHSEVIVHEVAHCLGLAHIFTGLDIGECLESGGLCQNSEPDCYCCGDYVCDTPVSPESISVSPDCSQSTTPSGLPLEVFRNYMSYADPGQCRDRFTPGQVRRMWTYLALAPALQNIRLQDVVYPTSSPSGVSGNIVVESGELVISSPLQMLPGATIRVKKGAKLRVASTITTTCGKMWQGIIVEGDAFDPSQSPASQGQVDVVNGGMIEHAECGIDVHDVLAANGGVGTGGGIVRLWLNSQMKDNIIGIRFGQYNFQNHSSFIGPIFSVTDDYRGGEIKPTLLELNSIKGLNIRFGRFLDLRTLCESPASRAIGIDSRNSGFRVLLSSSFEQLFRGIRADKLTETNGSLYVSESSFISCYKEIEMISSSSFAVTGNDFSINKPNACPSFMSEVKGVEIRGMTAGFNFSGNHFFSDSPSLPDDILIGTDCIELGEGMANTIFKNEYANLIFGNRASGFNGFDEDGLLYLCNANQINYGGDFRITGSIRKTQGEIVSGQLTRAAGNIFSGSPTEFWCTIVNQSAPIDYHFFVGDPAQDPGTPGDPNNICDVTGFFRKPTNQPNSSCAEPDPCVTCTEPEVEAWKTGFMQNRQQWLTKTASFPTTTNPAQQEVEAEEIRQLRLDMNQDANRILTQFSLDTLGVNPDSIVRWLGLVQTYPADLRLARHCFFTANYGNFDTVWGQIPQKYALDEARLSEFGRLGGVYALLRPFLQQGGYLHSLPSTIKDTLTTYTAQCDEAGLLAEVVLRRNGIELGPDCSEAQLRTAAEKQKVSATPGKQSGLKIYPNPVSDMLRIEYPMSNLGGNLRMFDIQGRLRHEMPLPARGGLAEISVGGLPNGLYVAQWFFNGQRGYAKVMVAH